MARNIFVESLVQTPIEKQENEMVERKGIGHPDSIADGLSESVSRSLCKEYLARFGRILHHNTDETQIVGGQSAPKFGGGNVLEPVYILLVGRAVTVVNGERIPYRTVAIRGAREYLEKNFTHLDVDTDVLLDCRIGQGSVDLRGLYETQKLLANDTSFGVSFAPLSDAETITLNTANHINGTLKKTMPELGEDIKVMTTRHKNDMHITVAVAMVGSELPDSDHYISTTEELCDIVHDYAARFTERQIKVDVNTGDDYKNDIFYLTVTGLSMENGDDGSVGRGNRANGLITPNRPMSMEACAGKNPVTHVGKIYNILANKIAHKIIDECGGDIREAYVRLLSQIGKPIDSPLTANAQLVLAKGVKINKVRSKVAGVVDNALENIQDLRNEIIEGKVATF